jgi:3-hydroxyisobutyrate dehydrogenase
MTHRVAFLGLGAMGSRMASNLLAGGHDVVAWNRSPDARERLAALGTRPADTPRAAASGADFIISMVTDDDASRSVWLDQEAGAVAGLAPGAIAIESSTVTPEWVETLAAAVVARGARFLDCPVAGSLPQAEARQLLVAINALLGIQIAAMAETLGYLEKAGLPTAGVLPLLAATPVVSPAAVATAKLIEAQDFAPRFPVDLVAKDFRYAVESGGRIGAELPMTAAARALFERLSGMGFGGENISAVARLYAGAR